MTPDTDARLAALEERVRDLEDRQEIARLIAGYGPLVDGGHAAAAAECWEPDGVYQVEDWEMAGRGAIGAMVAGDAHQGWIRGGCAHVLGPPHITLAGDEAVAVGHSLMLLHSGGGFTVRRATANRWLLRRGSAGWRVVRRTGRILDGAAAARALLILPEPAVGSAARTGTDADGG